METNASTAVESIDVSILTPIARQAVRREELHISDWRVSQLGGGAGNPVSVGLYRFEGTGRDGEGIVPWSVVLKVIQSPANVGMTDMGESGDPTHWNYWRRELLAYSSGLLDYLPEGLSTPRCLGTTEFPNNIARLWLEDVSDALEGPWPLERYALTARHLGRLNGMYVAERPEFPWLGQQRNRQWLSLIPWRSFPWEHPLARKRYPAAQNPFRHLLEEHERFLATLEELPKTICHGDTYPTNFKSRRGEQTVALDWALTGFEALGDDLGQFIFGAQENLKEVEPALVDKVLFESYLDGLHDSGCRTDPQWLRFGYVTSAAIRVGLFQVFLRGVDIEQEKPVTQNTEAISCFEVRMAEEAHELLNVIS